MADIDPSVRSTITNQARAEQSFRQSIVGNLSKLLSPQTPTELRVIVVTLLTVTLAISFIISVFLIHSLCFMLLRQPPYNPMHYVIVITVLMLACTGLSMPIIIRANTIEQALRLEDSFQKTIAARQVTTRRPR